MKSQPTAQSGTRRARWGIFITTLVMGGALVATSVSAWLQQREAAHTVAEARAHDLFRAVRRSLRDEGPPPRAAEALFDLDELLGDFADAGLRYVAFVTPRGEVLGQAGTARGALTSGDLRPGEPHLTRLAGGVADRVRIEGGLAPRRGRGVKLVLEVEPVLAARLESAAREHLVVSVIAAASLVLLAFVFWRMAARADRFEAALVRQRQLAALGEMSTVLGHELRNPLAALKGHAQLVVERLEPEHRGKRNAERVVEEAERIETLTTQILDFARTGAVTPADDDPAAMLREAADKAGDGRVRLDLARAPARWRFDRARMEQVVVNLLKNAAQASATSAIEVSCAVEAERLTIRVRDHGPGFPPGEEAALFEPFRTQRIHGTGLGLTIARRIVEAHGGVIGASNDPGGGAVVEVRLPGASSAAIGMPVIPAPGSA